MENVAFFDLEIFGKTDKKIRQIGAWWDGQTWKGSGVHALEQFCGKAPYRAGHNILAHDLAGKIRGFRTISASTLHRYAVSLDPPFGT